VISASSRLDDASAFDDTRPAAYVATQLTAMRKWGMGASFANYHFGPDFDPVQYAPYANALGSASAPADVDHEAPDVQVNPGGSSISGSAPTIWRSGPSDGATTSAAAAPPS
jgi:hypothetical protein